MHEIWSYHANKLCDGRRTDGHLAFLCPPPPPQWLRHDGGQHYIVLATLHEWLVWLNTLHEWLVWLNILHQYLMPYLPYYILCLVPHLPYYILCLVPHLPYHILCLVPHLPYHILCLVPHLPYCVIYQSQATVSLRSLHLLHMLGRYGRWYENCTRESTVHWNNIKYTV